MSHSSTFEEILELAESLPPEEQAELAGKILDMADVELDTFLAFFAELSELNQAELTSQCIEHNVSTHPEE